MTRVAMSAGFLLAAVLMVTAPALAKSSCFLVGWDSASATCTWTYNEYSEASASGEAHTWVVTLQPGNGGLLKDELVCSENGESGFWYDVFMDGTDVGDVCVPDDEAPETTVAQLALEEFRTYSWPRSTVTVQPPGGKTLVNLETVFYTSNNEPATHVFRLGGREVTVEATPVTYVWKHGDGSSESTRSAGHAYPDHDVFHVYGTTGSFAVSVDTVYGNGRYRVGQGEWKSIQGAPTVTIIGLAADLEVLEATPQLVR